MRIVSLLPSATEIVGALGLTHLLVGRSAECDYPVDVSALPVVTSARIDSEVLSGAQIDQAVRDAVLDGSSLYAVDAALIRELDPDLVITQDLCRVCAVSTDEVRRIEALDCDVLALDPHTIAEVEDSVHTVAGRLGRPELAAPVVAGMRDTIGSAAAAVDGLPRRRVFLAEWHDPPFASGHWLPEMVALAGGADVLGEAGAPSRPVTWDDVDAVDPEIVIVAPCGFDAARAARETAPRGDRPTVCVDANAYYSRPAPRIAAGVAQLAHLLHPAAAPDPGMPAIRLG
jgi:iron complex transport system substrate-binding protein